MKKQELIKKIIEGESFKFQGFQKGIFSNWYPIRFQYQDKDFYNSEQAFMYLKAKYFGDNNTAEKILNTLSPAIAKKFGREVSGFDEELWEEVREEFMYQAVRAKFMQNDLIKRTLLNTGDDVLVECSSADTIWGAGIDIQDSRINEPIKWPGENLLGFILMELRDKIGA